MPLIALLTVCGCAQQIPSSNIPDVYIGDVKAEPLTGKVVLLPKDDINLSTPEGKAQAKKLILDLTVSDRRNARGYNNLLKYHKQLKKIYSPTKKKVTPTS